MATKVDFASWRRLSGKDAREKAKDIPHGLVAKCEKCGHLLYAKDFEADLRVCRRCGYHARLTSSERLAITVDPDSFVEHAAELQPCDPLEFPEYAAKLQKAQQATGLKDAAVMGEATLSGHPLVVVLTDFAFFAGSMGSVVGEKVVLGFELAVEKSWPILAISSSGGGARMHEGILSLMQMAKTSAAVGKAERAGIPYLTLLVDHSMAGVQASFASLGDVIIAEPRTMIGFTGPRVIEQNLRIKLPKGFQSAEFQLAHGMIDMVVPRKQIRETLAQLLDFFKG